MSNTGYLLLADAILLIHALFVGFVVVGLILILAGGFRGWAWVRHRVFRILHVAAIGVVVAQAWLGARCPLTVLEMWLRASAGAATYTGDFVAHWVTRALYYEAPPWVFVAAYTAFGALVVATWLLVPPARRH